MNELIWVGNTLYPRWYVIAIVAGVIVSPFVIFGVVSMIRVILKGIKL